MAFLGFLVRRRRVPESAKNFRVFAKITTSLLLNSPRPKKRKTAQL
jgi:hypothetical protein